MVPIRILSTKKLLANQKQYLLNAGLSVIEADFISINLKSFSAEKINPNLIFTSTNAFKSFLQNEVSTRMKDNRIFCVGNATKRFIEEKGYSVAASADYAAELSKIIVEGYNAERFTFFSGSLRRETLPETLRNARMDFNEVEVYETILSPHNISAVLDGILFFSPSGIESYLLQNVIGKETCFCIGTTTAEALTDVTDKIIVANRPTIENVIIQCINYYS